MSAIPRDSEMESDTEAAVGFLRQFDPEGPWCLTAIIPDGGTETQTFGPGNEARIRRWINGHQGERNLYFTVNGVSGEPSSKPKKAEIALMRALHVDLDVNGKDAAAERADILRRLRAFEPAPSVIVDSGGGFQGFWLLDEPRSVTPENIEALEAYNRGLSKALGGDHCHNLDRVMRLPGTVNLPNAKKKKAGRVPALARIVEAHWDRAYSLGMFAPDGDDGTAKGNGRGHRDRTRSGAAFRLGLRTRRAGRSFERFCEAAGTDPETSAWCREKGEAHDGRELNRIWTKAAQQPSGPPWKIDLRAPYDTARLLLEVEFSADGLPTLHRHRGGFYAWNGTAFPEVTDAEIRAQIYDFLDECVATVEDGKTVKLQHVSVQPNTRIVNDVADALRAAALLPDKVAAPAWLDDTTQPEPGELTACANGLLHLPTRDLLPHSPMFFSHNALDYAYDPAAPKPANWLAFLKQLWPDDAESIVTLREIFGYCLTPDTTQQKAFLIVGPKRSGKGTIARVLRRMVGAVNAVAPTLAGLGTQFGLQPLIGRRVAIIFDARLGGRADQAAIAERLLSITGEDAITIDRKYREAWTGKLGIRFLILTNELPRLADASGALTSRFIVLVLTESFYGREDLGLTDKLLAELPGILNWSIEGWRRLRRRGHFLQPASARDAIDDLDALGSPVGAFVRERCEVGPGKRENVDKIFREWGDWCAAQGRDKPGTKQTLGRDLRAVVPGLRVRQKRDGDRFYEGVGLRAL